MHPSMPVPVGVHFTTEPSGYDLLVLDELPIDLLNVFFGAGEFTAFISRAKTMHAEILILLE